MARKIAYNIAGIAMPVAIFIGAAIVVMGLFLRLPMSTSPYAVNADTASTTVTVLNTPPTWSASATEYIESSTSSPTNAGDDVVIVGTANDGNGEQYYLLVCKTSSTPTANPGAPPDCAGGASNQWAISAFTPSDQQATSTYTSTSTDAEENVWFAWICDANASNPACNAQYTSGFGTGTSPFYINHRPTFTAVSNDSPVDPGGVVTWTATTSDADVVTTADLTRLWVCQSDDFANGSCGVGGTFCSSTLHATNPTCSSTFAIPQQDKTYNAYTYVVDEHDFAAVGGVQGTTSTYTINNVAPYIETSTMELLDVDESGSLTLDTPEGTSTGFIARVRVIDDNSCQADGGGNEISSLVINVFRSGIGSGSCQVNGDYNPNNCYPGSLATGTWNVTYTPSSTCSATSTDHYWDATFPLWYVADPTDGTATNTVYSAEYWTFTARATDDDGATSTLEEDPDGNEMGSFLAFDVTESQISYGALLPGSSTDPIVATTTLRALGNIGLDEDLSGDPMCTTYPACDPNSTTSTIPASEQVYATSSVPYASGTALATSSSELELNVPKTTATSSPQSRSTNWGLRIPGTITLAGDYTGQNEIIAKRSEPSEW